MTRAAYDKIAAGLNEALATAPPRLTKAQENALLWLPNDGSPRFPMRLADPNYLDLLDLRTLGFAEYAEDINDNSLALTPAGIAARKELEKRGDAS